MRKMQLDILRGIAIILVLGHHMAPMPENIPNFLLALFRGWQHIGWIGVDLFFVLSGFLISGLLFKEYAETHTFSLGRFLVRRGLKIYPSYYVFLLLALPVALMVPGLVTPRSFACEALFVPNYFENIWGHTWTLAIEEHFYLLLALGFFIASRHKDPFKYVVPACYGFIILALCLRINIIHQIPFHEKPHYTATILRLDALSFGVLLSCYFHQNEELLKHWINRYKWILIPAGVALILPCAIGGHEQIYLYTIGLSLLYVGWGILLLVAMSHELQTKNKIIVCVAKIGIYSYSIYLWHKPFSALCSLPSSWCPGHPGANLRLLIYFVLSISVGIGMSKCVEWPVLRLRDRLFPPRYTGGAV